MDEALIAEYLASLAKLEGFTAASLDRHRRVCQRWLERLAAKCGRSLEETLPKDLLAFISERGSQGVTALTIRSELCVLRTFYDWLFRYRKILWNPAVSLPRMICQPPREKLWLTVEESFRLLEAIDTSEPIGLRDSVIVALLWSTGLRNRELVSLCWRDLDLEQGALLVRCGKGGKQRQVFLNDRVREDLGRYRQELDGGPDDPVFFAIGAQVLPVGKRRPLSASRLVELIRARAVSVGLAKPINPLTFRHTFATHMYEVGATVEEIKEMLGHDAESETTIYIHVTLAAARQLLAEHTANPLKYGWRRNEA
jgi:site-specific recombinase XerD